MAGSAPRRRARHPGVVMAVVGIAIAIAASGNPDGSLAGPRYALALELPAWLALFVAAALLAVFLAIVSALVPSPPPPDDDEAITEIAEPPQMSPWTAAALLAIPMLLALAVVSLLWRQSPGWTLAPPFRLTAGLLAEVSRPAVPSPAPLHEASAQLALTIALTAGAAMVLAGAGIAIAAASPWDHVAAWLRRRPRRRSVAAALADALARGQDDIAMETDDPRQAVIACYRRCEAALTPSLRRRDRAETPRAFVRVALQRLDLPAAPTAVLLDLFERARFGLAPLSIRDRDAAIAALAAIRADLASRTGHAA